MTRVTESPQAMLETMCRAAETAGRAVARIHIQGFNVERKADDSPVTEADLAAHRIIAEALSDRFPDIPVLSEEGEVPSAEVRASWRRLFVVDPLDGTKDFVNGHGQFTVNIALVEGGRPVLGVIQVPVTGRLYYGGPGLGAFRCQDQGPAEPLSVTGPGADPGVVVLHSRTRKTPKLDTYLGDAPVRGRISVSSSLKFCILAEGGANVYACLHPTWEWDTAAGQALVEGAGGRVCDLHGNTLRYNKPDLLNPYFVADWGGFTSPGTLPD